jgi:hypothetical protein
LIEHIQECHIALVRCLPANYGELLMPEAIGEQPEVPQEQPVVPSVAGAAPVSGELTLSDGTILKLEGTLIAYSSSADGAEHPALLPGGGGGGVPRPDALYPFANPTTCAEVAADSAFFQNRLTTLSNQMREYPNERDELMSSWQGAALALQKCNGLRAQMRCP